MSSAAPGAFAVFHRAQRTVERYRLGGDSLGVARVARRPDARTAWITGTAVTTSQMAPVAASTIPMQPRISWANQGEPSEMGTTKTQKVNHDPHRTNAVTAPASSTG